MVSIRSPTFYFLTLKINFFGLKKAVNNCPVIARKGLTEAKNESAANTGQRAMW